MYNSDMGSLLGVLLSFGIGLILVCLAVAVVQIVAMWKVFEKSGEAGWKYLIPVYNMYLMYKLIWGNGWYFLLCFIPLCNLVIGVATSFKMAKAYGKETAFGFGLLFLNIVFVCILAFDKKISYVGPQEGSNKKLAIVGGVLGVLYFLIQFIAAL